MIVSQIRHLNLATMTGFEVVVRFLDPEGKELLAEKLTLQPSQTAFVDYKPSLTKTPTKPTPIAIRHPLKVEVEVLSGDNARHFLLPTVEIFDSATRVTTILLPLINPQPEPPAPVVTPPVK